MREKGRWPEVRCRADAFALRREVAARRVQPIEKTPPHARFLQRIFQLPAVGVRCSRLIFPHAGHNQFTVPMNCKRGRKGSDLGLHMKVLATLI
jgi:hypothetical protein